MNKPIYIPAGNYYTVTQIASLHKVDRATVVRRLNEGHLKGIKTGFGWLIEAADLETFKQPKVGRPALPLIKGQNNMEYARETPLLIVPTNFNFSLLPPDSEAPIFDANGGEPDGKGPYAHPRDDFGTKELEIFLANGAYEIPGWAINYDRNYQKAQQGKLEFCGYQSQCIAYAWDKETAKYLSDTCGGPPETFIENNLTIPDLLEWQHGGLTPHLEKLIKTADDDISHIEIWGEGETLTVIIA